MNAAELTTRLKDEARRLGFALAGACPAVTPTGIDQFGQWLDRGYGGQMDYLEVRRAAYEHPRYVLDGARSILMLAMEYAGTEPKMPQPGQGRISRYAWSPVDYHDVIHERLKTLVALVKELAPGAAARGVVDSAPLLEREFAQLAGLGWVGKNTLLLNKHRGSYFFLAALLTDQELVYDDPFTADHCGTCTACLDACPTKAFPQPYVLDATRCISYLTIELRDEIPADLRPGIGDWLFGCDICQEVCPWNRKEFRVPGSEFRVEGSNPQPETRNAERGTNREINAFLPSPDSNPVDLIPLFDLDDDAFRRRFRATPLWRAKRRGILRNAAIILGNQKCREAIPALTRGLSDSEPLIREACQWALEQMELPRIGRSSAISR
jgi:epoxyqueuosine reductase